MVVAVKIVFTRGVQKSLIITWPKVVEAGSLSDSLIGSVDIASTLLEIARDQFDNRDMDDVVSNGN